MVLARPDPIARTAALCGRHARVVTRSVRRSSFDVGSDANADRLVVAASRSAGLLAGYGTAAV
jgi:hypothetical protein